MLDVNALCGRGAFDEDLVMGSSQIKVSCFGTYWAECLLGKRVFV